MTVQRDVATAATSEACLRVLRAATALQVAAYEILDSRIAPALSISAMIRCRDEIAATIKDIKRLEF